MEKIWATTMWASSFFVLNCLIKREKQQQIGSFKVEFLAFQKVRVFLPKILWKMLQLKTLNNGSTRDKKIMAEFQFSTNARNKHHQAVQNCLQQHLQGTETNNYFRDRRWMLYNVFGGNADFSKIEKSSICTKLLLRNAIFAVKV